MTRGFDRRRIAPFCRLQMAIRGRCAAACSQVILFAIVSGCSSAISPLAIQDAQLAARVKTVLVNDPELGPRAVEVRVTAGVVRLSGRVRSDAEISRAVELARSVPGVRDVRSDLQFLSRPSPKPSGGAPERSPSISQLPEQEQEDDRRLLAVGGSVRLGDPRTAGLGSALTVGPLVRFGSGSGLGFDLGFSWLQTELSPGRGSGEIQGRLSMKPVMAGAGYRLSGDRFSANFSLVGGVAFNSIRLLEGGAGQALALGADNSLACRPGISAWYDLNRRTAFNLFVGYLITRPRVTFLEAGHLEKRVLRADTALVSVGVAYKIF